jgi:hypothetical protein
LDYKYSCFVSIKKKHIKIFIILRDEDLHGVLSVKKISVTWRQVCIVSSPRNYYLFPTTPKFHRRSRARVVRRQVAARKLEAGHLHGKKDTSGAASLLLLGRRSTFGRRHVDDRNTALRLPLVLARAILGLASSSSRGRV